MNFPFIGRTKESPFNERLAPEPVKQPVIRAIRAMTLPHEDVLDNLKATLDYRTNRAKELKREIDERMHELASTDAAIAGVQCAIDVITKESPKKDYKDNVDSADFEASLQKAMEHASHV